MTPASAVLPQNLQMDAPAPKFITQKIAEMKMYCVLYIGDTLTDRQKRSPAYRLGGKLFMQQRTVPNNIVSTCAITRLDSAMRHVHKQLVDPKRHDQYVSSYVHENQWNSETQRFENVEYGFVMRPGPNGLERVDNGLLYKEINPVNELWNITGGDTGVVLIEEGLESAADIKDAQMHYFPNWLDILQLKATVPLRLRDLEDHIENRKAATNSTALKAVGDAYLRSCLQYRDWGKTYVDFQTQVIKETEKSPGGARYDEVAERLFKQLELTRQDSLVADMARNSNDTQAQNTSIAAALEKVAEANMLMAQGQARMDTMIELMAKVALGKEVEGLPAAESQPPAPETPEEAVAAFDQAAEGSSFTDMSAAVALTDEEAAAEAEYQAETARYLEQAGIKEEDEAPKE
jgi:hypothetical protein